MSIFVMCSSAYPPEEARQKIANAIERYHDILKHFWVSDVREPLEHEQEHATEYGITVNSGFLVQWNKEGGAEYIPGNPAHHLRGLRPGQRIGVRPRLRTHSAFLK